MRKANFFLVGEPKTATTTLHDVLVQHPEIYMSALKDFGFFRIPKKERTKKEYLKRFGGAKDQKIIGESATLYIHEKNVAEDIYKDNPKAKILMIFRYPPDYLISWHAQRIFNQLTYVEPRFEDAIRNGWIEQAKYYEHAKRFFDVFPRKQILVLVFDDFKKNPKKFYQSILKFLEIDDKHIPKIPHKNPRKNLRFGWLKKILNDMQAVKIKKYLPRWINVLITRLFRAIMNKKSPKQNMDKKTERYIIDKTKDEIRKLSKLTKVNFEKKWKYR